MSNGDQSAHDSDLSSGSTQVYQPSPAPQGPGGSTTSRTRLETDEVLGDSEAFESANGDGEVANPPATESGEEFAEASPEQLAAAGSGPESAVSDLTGIEGFEFIPASESAEAADGFLPEAGSAVDGGGQGEFFGAIVGALAPALISSVGPSIAKGLVSRLSPRARRVVTRPRPPRPAAKPGAPAPAAASLDMILKLLQQALAKPGGESGPESTEAAALVEEAAAVLEVIIGTDDRVRITSTTSIPWRRICALRINFSGRFYRGTGFLIGPRAVVTAGHCVYMHGLGWARSIEVYPGANGSSYHYGKVTSGSFRSVTGWVTNKRPESDYGCIVLPQGSFGGRNLGSFGFAALTPQELVAAPAVLAGFPGDKPFAEMWGMARRIKTVNANTLTYDIDTMGGQSGAPVYIKRNGQRKVVGIHNYGASSGNSATRITPAVYNRLLAWRQL